MTKRHFIAFANRIKALRDRKVAAETADLVANVAIEYNANFDRERFLSACGL